MIIALGGKGGAGKSTVAKLLAQKLDFAHYSMGDLMRELAVKRCITILELNKQAEKDSTIDKWLDKKQQVLGRTKDKFIIDSRMGFLFIPHAIKIFLDVDDKTAAERIMQAPPRKGERRHATVDDALKALCQRRKSEIKRLKKYYGVNPYDKRHYQLIIDTTHLAPSQVQAKIFAYLKKRYVESIFSR